MSMVGHHYPCAQLVALTLEETNRVRDETRQFWVAQVTDAVTCIEVFIHAIGIPSEKFLLLVPGKRAFCRRCLLKDGVTLLFEPEQDFLWKGAGLAECDEIRAAFLFEMREGTSEMKATDQRIGLFE
jgi:hypothetical protein